MQEPLAREAEALMTALAQTLTAAGAARLMALPSGTPVAEPAGLPVLRWLGPALEAVPSAAEPALTALVTAAPRLAWRQTYSRDEAPDTFLDNYGWTELVGAKGLYRDPAVSAGLLILGPRTDYPPHSHPALEHYVPLSGVADWYDEDHGWRSVAPLTVVRHRPGVRHAMRTGADPLIAYFLWSGADIGVSARLDHPAA